MLAKMPTKSLTFFILIISLSLPAAESTNIATRFCQTILANYLDELYPEIKGSRPIFATFQDLRVLLTQAGVLPHKADRIVALLQETIALYDRDPGPWGAVA